MRLLPPDPARATHVDRLPAPPMAAHTDAPVVPPAILHAAWTAGGPGPSAAGLVTVVILLVIAVVGAARTIRRRLDPRCRAEALFLERAGLDATDRRVLRRAARRVEPPVPAASLLLCPRLMDLARHGPACSGVDAARLGELARRRFGREPADAVDGAADPAGAAGAAGAATGRPRVRPLLDVVGHDRPLAMEQASRRDGLAVGGQDPPDAAPHRSRTVKLLAVAMAAAEERRADPVVPGEGAVASRPRG